MTESQRLDRIGELLCKAILRMDWEDANSLRVSEMGKAGDERANRILRLVSDLGPLPPDKIGTMMNLSRATAYRVLRRLVDEGMMVTSGRTKAAIYMLATHPGRS